MPQPQYSARPLHGPDQSSEVATPVNAGKAPIDDKNQWNKVKKFSKQVIVSDDVDVEKERLDSLEELLDDRVIPNYVPNQ